MRPDLAPMYGGILWMQWLRKFDLSPVAVMIALQLVEYISLPNGQAYPSLKLMAERVRRTPDHVRTCMRELERAGIVAREERFDELNAQTSNRYYLLDGPRRPTAPIPGAPWRGPKAKTTSPAKTRGCP